jgi:hypothetical protein
MAVSVIGGLQTESFAPELAPFDPSIIDSRHQAFDFVYGGQVPGYDQLLRLGHYVKGFTEQRSLITQHDELDRAERPPVYVRRTMDGTTEALSEPDFRRHQAVADPAHWRLTRADRERLQAVVEAKNYSDIYDLIGEGVNPAGATNAEAMLAEAQADATRRLELDHAIHLDQVLAGSHHAVRSGATRIGSRALRVLKGEFERDGLLASVRRSRYTVPLPRDMFTAQAPAVPETATVAPETPVAPADTFTENRLWAAARAVGRGIAGLLRGPNGRHRA